MNNGLPLKYKLDEALKAIHCRNDMEKAFNGLSVELSKQALLLPKKEWLQEIAVCRAHPVFPLLHEDPCTKRAFEKPRGYAGDAVMLDYIYDHSPPPGISEVGLEVSRMLNNTLTSRSVVARRDFAAEKIDEVASKFNCAKVLSLACGHLREASFSQACLSGKLGALYAIDQDAESLRVVDEAKYTNLQTIRMSVKDILKNGKQFSGLHFVYSLGLYDYLNERAAKALTKRLFDMLAPGGTFIIANYVPDAEERGYVEAIMDWWLVYRTTAELQECASTIDQSTIASKKVYCRGVMAYLELIKA